MLSSLPVPPPLAAAPPLQDDYGVPEDQIFGIRYGLRGFLDRHAKPVQLSRQAVDGIQLKGGTVLVGGGQRRPRQQGGAWARWLQRCCGETPASGTIPC